MFVKYLVKIEKISAWILFFVILIYAVTGYGMTRGFGTQLFRTLHLEWLGLIGLLVFIIHTSWGISLALKRWRIWNITTKSLLFIFYVAIVLFFVFVHFFYQSSGYGKSNDFKNEPTVVNQEAGTTIFTKEILAQFNGLNGNAAYVAVDGIVYDVSSVFLNGEHHGWSAGQDLSSEFYQEHSASKLKGYTIVGTYQAN